MALLPRIRIPLAHVSHGARWGPGRKHFILTFMCAKCQDRTDFECSGHPLRLQHRIDAYCHLHRH
jgi:hypothetical protein